MSKRSVKFVEPDEFKNAGDRDGLGIRKGFSGVLKQINPERRTVDFVISTGDMDRDGDVIFAQGWELEAYRRNPVVLWAHDQRQLPIAKALDISVRGSDLISTAEFTSREQNPFGDTVFKLLQGKYLNATSVGFMPLEFEFSEDESRGFMAMDILKQELWEYSVVPVPANPNALVAASAKGIDVDPLMKWAEQVLDEQAPQAGEAREIWNQLRKSQGFILSLGKQLSLAEENLRRLKGEKANEDDEENNDSTVAGDDPNLPPEDDEVHLPENEDDRLDDEEKDTKVRSIAREPEYEGTEETPWGDVDAGFDAFVAGYFKANPDAEQPDTMPTSITEAPQALLSWASARTLIGEPDADNVEDVLAYPVVNPDTNQLNGNALREAISQADQSDLPDETIESIKSVARGLLATEFGETDEGGDEGEVTLSAEERARKAKALRARLKYWQTLVDSPLGR